MQSLLRIFKTTFKQISRSGWLSWASILVMTLSFVVTIVFMLLAFTLNLVLQSIENEPHIYMFYKAGTSEIAIQKTVDEWSRLDNIESIIYTTEEEALSEFKSYNQKTNPIAAEALREGILPGSLGIRLKSIESADEIIDLVENEKLENDSVLTVGYSEDVIENIKDIASIVRVGGGVVVGLLVLVILLFTLLTVEFKIFHRSEEIGVMQLVGGGLWYIRLPFILESAFYGILGALLAEGIIIGSYYGILRYYSQSELIQFLNRFFGDLAWPQLTSQEAIGVLFGILGIGALIGIINSYLAISRYIK